MYSNILINSNSNVLHCIVIDPMSEFCTQCTCTCTCRYTCNGMHMYM